MKKTLYLPLPPFNNDGPRLLCQVSWKRVDDDDCVIVLSQLNTCLSWCAIIDNSPLRQRDMEKKILATTSALWSSEVEWTARVDYRKMGQEDVVFWKCQNYFHSRQTTLEKGLLRDKVQLERETFLSYIVSWSGGFLLLWYVQPHEDATYPHKMYQGTVCRHCMPKKQLKFLWQILYDYKLLVYVLS